MNRKLKKLVITAMALSAIFLLASCGNKDNTHDSASGGSSSSIDSAASIPPATISNEADEYTKKLVPLTYEPGEQVESLYYRSVVDNNEVFYEVQPEGETERVRVPVAESVIYVVSDDDECQVVKTHFKYTVEGSNPVTIEQYRIYATPATVNLSDDSQNVQPNTSMEIELEQPVDNNMSDVSTSSAAEK